MTKITTLAEAREHETRLMADMAYAADDMDKAANPAALAGAIGRYRASQKALTTLRRGIKRHFVADVAAEAMSDDALLAALEA